MCLMEHSFLNKEDYFQLVSSLFLPRESFLSTIHFATISFMQKNLKWTPRKNRRKKKKDPGVGKKY